MNDAMRPLDILDDAAAELHLLSSLIGERDDDLLLGRAARQGLARALTRLADRIEDAATGLEQANERPHERLECFCGWEGLREESVMSLPMEDSPSRPTCPMCGGNLEMRS